MSKWVEIRLVTFSDYLVEIKDDESQNDAEEIVSGDVFDWDEMTSKVVDDADELESLKGHTDNDKIYYMS